MGKGEYLGEFEYVVLLALQRLGPEAYGIRVRQELRDRGGREVSVPTVYAALDRLERKGYIESWLGDATPERGGRAKRFFAVRPAGLRAARASRDLFASMSAGLSLDHPAEPGR